MWFLENLIRWLRLLSGHINVTFLITTDINDPTMNAPQIIGCLHEIRKTTEAELILDCGENSTRCAAYNNGMDKVNFRVVMPIQDDLEPQEQDYDAILLKDYLKLFPNYEGVLSYSDGRSKPWVRGFPIIGRRVYDDLGYLCHPDYTAWSDKDLTRVVEKNYPHHHIERVMFLHNRGKYGHDMIYKRAIHSKKVDRRKYNRRRQECFPK